jgi:hypothetical protein
VYDVGDDCNLILVKPGADLPRVRALLESFAIGDQAHPPDVALRATVAPQWVTSHLSDAEAARAVSDFARAGAEVIIHKGQLNNPFGGPYDVVLVAPGPERVKTIKALRAITGLDIAAAKQQVDSCPCTIAQGLDARNAAQAVIDLRTAGAEAHLEGLDAGATAPATEAPDSVGSIRSSDRSAAGGQRFCTHCGTPAGPEARFCGSCGTALSTATGAPPIPGPDPTALGGGGQSGLELARQGLGRSSGSLPS